MKPLESNLEGRVVRWARLQGVKSIKLNVWGSGHWPDREFFIQGGRPALVEFKRPGEKPRRAQLFVIRSLVEFGYDVMWSDNYEEIIAWLRERIQNAKT